MLNQQHPNITHRTIPPIAPIDPQPLIEHGIDPVSIILSIAILISILLGSLTGLIWVILMNQTKPSR